MKIPSFVLAAQFQLFIPKAFNNFSESPRCLDLLITGFYLANRRVNKGKAALWKVNGIRVCSKFFAFLHCISVTKLGSIVANVEKNGFSGLDRQCRHYEPKRVEKTLAGITDVKNYLEGRMINEGIAVPGKCPSHSEYKAVRFPSHYTKLMLYEQYKSACVARGDEKIIVYSTFLSYWESGCPHLGIMGRSSDVCDYCREHMMTLGALAALPEGELKEAKKREELSGILKHLEHVKSERLAYNQSVKSAKDAFSANPAAPELITLSFDYAEGKLLPYYSTQPQQLHFLSRRKVNIFGVNDEGSGHGTVYLYDEEESAAIGKGASSVCSLLYHYLGRFISNAGEVRLQCDNCSGQNKNWIVTSFLGWLTWPGQCPNVSLHFMVEAHSKFSPDRSFGLVSLSFLRSQAVECIQDMISVVSRASKTLTPILVNDSQGGRSVNWFRLEAFLAEYFRPIPNIKRYHVFRYLANKPGVVFCNEWSTSAEEQAISIFKPGITEFKLPNRISSAFIPPDVPLPAARSWYIYDNLRRFCSPDKQDLLAPLPTVPRPVAGSSEASSFRQGRAAFIPQESEGQGNHRICIERPPPEQVEVCPEESDEESQGQAGWAEFGPAINEDELGELDPVAVQNIEEGAFGQSVTVDIEQEADVLPTSMEEETDTGIKNRGTWKRPMKRPVNLGRCGTCDPCLLYQQYFASDSKNNLNVPSSKRFKCGKCSNCKNAQWKKGCKNVTCINMK